MNTISFAIFLHYFWSNKAHLIVQNCLMFIINHLRILRCKVTNTLFVICRMSDSNVKYTYSYCITQVIKKLKFSHTPDQTNVLCYRALGPELIPVYRQSAHRSLLSHPRWRQANLTFRQACGNLAKHSHCPSTSTKLYCLVTEAHSCKQLAQGCYAAFSRSELNPWPIDRRSSALPLCHCATSPIVDLLSPVQVWQ